MNLEIIDTWMENRLWTESVNQNAVWHFFLFSCDLAGCHVHTHVCCLNFDFLCTKDVPKLFPCFLCLHLLFCCVSSFPCPHSFHRIRRPRKISPRGRATPLFLLNLDISWPQLGLEVSAVFNGKKMRVCRNGNWEKTGLYVPIWQKIFEAYKAALFKPNYLSCKAIHDSDFHFWNPYFFTFASFLAVFKWQWCIRTLGTHSRLTGWGGAIQSADTGWLSPACPPSLCPSRLCNWQGSVFPRKALWCQNFPHYFCRQQMQSTLTTQHPTINISSPKTRTPVATKKLHTPHTRTSISMHPSL